MNTVGNDTSPTLSFQSYSCILQDVIFLTTLLISTLLMAQKHRTIEPYCVEIAVKPQAIDHLNER